MKRFLLFANARWYPAGGWRDFRGSFDTLSETEEALVKLQAEKDYMDWYQIVDTATEEIIYD